jgi:hypothetical protein
MRSDGYTLLVVISGNAINATLYPNLTLKFIRDIAPVAVGLRLDRDEFAVAADGEKHLRRE